ncbi:MAG: GGDEF domain-containing protein [Gemmatimonadota bacterium]
MAVSLLALSVTAVAARRWPASLSEFAVLAWLLAAVPSFLFAYYRGWSGAALGLGATIVGLLVLQALPIRGSSGIDWPRSLSLTTALFAVSFGAGWVTESLRRRRSRALDMAYADALTGLPNRRVIDFFLERHFAVAREGPGFTIVLFDLDDFKRLNDRLGHTAGDQALVDVGTALRESTRRMDILARYGGEEFVAILPGEGVDGAAVFAERIRAAIGRVKLPDGSPLTVSAGIAAFASDMTSPGDLVQAADEALFEAKRMGGNRIQINSGTSRPQNAAAS